MKSMSENELKEHLHSQVVLLLTGAIKMTQAEFCDRAGIKSINTLRLYVNTKKLSGHSMIGKIIKGLGLTITYTISVNREGK